MVQLRNSFRYQFTQRNIGQSSLPPRDHLRSAVRGLSLLHLSRKKISLSVCIEQTSELGRNIVKWQDAEPATVG